jgi:transcriptional regulator with XRE-family HTH domain
MSIDVTHGVEARLGAENARAARAIVEHMIGQLDVSARPDADLTRKDLARMSGLDRATLGRWAAGLKTSPELEHLVRALLTVHALGARDARGVAHLRGSRVAREVVEELARSLTGAMCDALLEGLDDQTDARCARLAGLDAPQARTVANLRRALAGASARPARLRAHTTLQVALAVAWCRALDALDQDALDQ